MLTTLFQERDIHPFSAESDPINHEITPETDKEKKETKTDTCSI